MSMISCMVQLNLGGKIPDTELKETAGEYAARGMEPDAAMIRAVQEKLDMARMEERSIVAAVRAAFEAKGGTKKSAPAIAAQSEAAAAPAAAPIADFGEKIIGARKDVWAGYADKMKDAEGADLGAVPLSKSWPEPDYQKMIDAGADPWTMAFIRAARDAIPTKPSASWKLKSWVGKVESLRGFANDLMSGKIAKEKLQENLASPAHATLAETMGGRVELYMAVGHGKSLKGVSVYSADYGMHNGIEYKPAKRIYTVQQEAKATAFSNWPRELAIGDTRAEAIANFFAKYETLDINKPAAKTVSFDLYSKRGGDGTIFIGKKVGKTHIDLKEFSTVAEARKYKAEHQEELERLLAAKKEIPNERRESNSPRVGVDHRGGADVTPALFGDAFGFRGVQFGNYVEGARRQTELNEAYDALMDMAGVLGIPARALSLNGELGLAFGARGKGGKRAPKAHYEPGQVVINLTKSEGAGSLGHEWFHALDNYFSRSRNQKGDMMTEALDVSLASRAAKFLNNTSVRSEMIQAFGDVMAAINQTALKMRSLDLDMLRSKPYWSTNLEMAARSFESYLINKLADQGAANDYLANIVSEDDFNNETAYPYPTAGEIPAIRAAFDSFFDTIEARPADDGGVVLASVEPTFYSALARTIPDMAKIAGKDGTIKPEQARLWLASRQKEGKFKADELLWSGVDDWLKAQDGRVTVDDIGQFIEQNGVQVKEVEKGGRPPNAISADEIIRMNHLRDERRERDLTPEESAELRDIVQRSNAEDDYAVPTKYSQYVLPGGENYRELLLTLPEPDRLAAAKKNGLVARKTDDAWIAPGEWRIFNAEGDGIGVMEGATADDALRAWAAIQKGDNGGAVYKSSHWDESNIIAHVRFNDRTDADGKKVLFVEELQSDWGQDGLKKGFFDADAKAKARAKYDEVDAKIQALSKKMTDLPDSEMDQFTALRDERDALYAERLEASKQMETASGKSASIQTAPFVTDTKAWLSLGIKRMIRYAAENGYDKVAFVNGEQSAARYDLSKQVDRIRIRPMPFQQGTKTYGITGFKDGDIVLDREVKSLADLDDMIGKDAANIARKQIDGNGSADMTGTDLKVGGEGMKAFYDKIVPQTISDVLKKLGGGKVAQVDIRAKPGTPLAAWDKGSSQTGFDITPELRAKALAGMPLFSKSKEVGVSAVDAKVAALVREGTTVDAVLAQIETSSGNADNRVLAGAIRALGLKTAITYETARAGQRFSVSTASADNVRGGYRINDDTAILYRDDGAEFSVLHELVHAATIRALAHGGAAAVKIKALYAQAKVLPQFAGAYGIANAEEFIAEAYTSAQFRQLLADTPAPGGQTFWQKLMNIVRSIFGKATVTDSMLDAVMRAGPALMAENQQAVQIAGDERAGRGESNSERTIEVDGVRRPITNSRGQLVGQDFAAQTAFWKFFGDSVVVDADGRPMPVYHGTRGDISEFDPKDGSELSPFNMGNKGIYFTKSIALAEAYARSRDGNRNTDGGNIMPVYLRIENPFIIEKGADFDTHISSAYVSTERIEELKNRGYDGIINHSAKEMVAFDAVQIKSATGNAGTFDPSNPDIRASVAPPGPPPRGQQQLFSRAPAPVWSDPEMTKLDDVIHTLQDKFVDMRRTVQAVRGVMADLDDKWDPYLQEELFHGRSATGFKNYLHDELRPLLSDMQARGVGMDEFEEYLHMRHAEEANIQIASVNLEMPDGGSGIKTADAQDYLANQAPAKLRAFEALAARVDAMNAETQRLLVDYGLEKQDTINAWNATYEHYVPLMREDMDVGKMGNGTGQGYSVRGSSSKRRTGSDRAVVNILANIAMARERAVVRGEKNRLDLALYGLALKAPNPDFWRPVNPQKNPDALRDELIGMGLSPTMVAAIMEEPRQKVIDPQTGLVVRRVNTMLRSAPNVVAVRVNGEDRFIFFQDRNERAMRMAMTLKNMTGDNLNRFMSTAGIITRAFAAINTQYNPIFGIVNLVRDTGEGLINLSATPLAGKQGEFTVELGSLLGKVARHGFRLENMAPDDLALWQEFQREGGITGFRAMFNTSDDRANELGSELKRMAAGPLAKAGHAVFDWLSDYNEALENVTRMSVYKVAKANGMSMQQAASLAKNLTVNFNRKGAIGSQVGSLYAFFNAATQGTARTFTTLSSPAGKKIIAGGLLLGVLQAVIMAAAGFDDDDLPEFIKAKNLMIPLGLVSGKKNYVSVPLPQGYAVIPTLGRLITEFAIGGGKKPGKYLAGVISSMLDTFNPLGSSTLLQTLSPTATDPIAALAENQDFTGKPIARKDMSSLKPTPGYTRTKDTASIASKTLSYYLNLWTGGTKYTPGAFSPTPDQIDYLLGQLTGGVGRELMKVQQTGSAALSGEDLPAYKVPLLSRFYGNAEDKSSVSTKFYANLLDSNLHAEEVNGRAKDHGDVRGYLAEHPEARLADLASTVQRELSELGKHKRELVEKGADRAKVKELELKMRGIMDRFNQKVDAVKKKVPA